MELSLSNFRSWEEKVFKFVDEGIVLISGESGSGKSTLFHAINFALYGKGTKIVTNGKKKCVVKLTWKGITIIRTRCPNRLIVNDIFEDSIGQGIIDDKFGSNFTAKSFIQQKSAKSFLSLTPSDKLIFLEKEAIHGGVSKLKQRTHSFTKKTEKECDYWMGKIDMCNEMLDENPLPIEIPLPIVLKDVDKNKIKLCFKNEKIRSKNCDTRVGKINRKIEVHLRELKNITENNMKVRTQQELKSQLCKLQTQLQYETNTLGTLITKEIQTVKNIQLFIKNENIKIKQNDSTIVNLNQQKMQCFVDIGNSKENKLKQQQIKDLKHEIKQLEEEMKDNKFINNLDLLESKLQLYNNSVLNYNGYITRLEHHNELTNKLRDLGERVDIDIIKKNLSCLSITIRKKIKQLDDKNKIEKLTIHPNTLENLKYKVNECNIAIEDNKSNIESLQVKTCPQCSTILSNNHGKLVVFHKKISTSSKEDINKNIKRLQQKRKKLESEIAVHNNNNKQLDMLTNQLCKEVISNLNELKDEKIMLKNQLELGIACNVNISHLEKRLKNINVNIVEKPNTINVEILEDRILNARTKKKQLHTLSASIKLKKVKVAKIEVFEYEDEESLINSIRLLELNILTIEKFKLERSNIIKEQEKMLKYLIIYEDLTQKIANIELNIDNISILDCRNKVLAEQDITDLKIRIKLKEKEKINHSNNISEIENYLKYRDLLKKSKNWQNKHNLFTNNFNKKTDEYKSALELKNLIVKAESESLSNYIHTLNLHVAHYLEIFFPSDPINVKLLRYKESKKKIRKFQITLEVKYKGMEIDLNSISGGEYDRVQLAFALALSEIGNSKLVLLDESISSLDENTCSIVLNGIKSAGRLTLIVSHQITSGEFDQIVEV
jgi:exonuclease SbcC